MKALVIISLCLVSAITSSLIVYYNKPQEVIIQQDPKAKCGTDWECEHSYTLVVAQGSNGYAIYSGDMLIGTILCYQAPELDRIIATANQ